MAAVLVLRAAQRHDRSDDGRAVVTIEEATLIFPSAAGLAPRDVARNAHPVLDQAGNVIGLVLKTSPETDDIVGYSGPSNLLVGLRPDGSLSGVRLLSSRDTDEHVERVKQDERFWKSFEGRRAHSEGLSGVEAVSGSTLTSLAMVESVERRLSGHSASLRFPKEIAVDEVRAVFPDAVELAKDEHCPGWKEVRDAGHRTLGYVLRSSPYAESIRGYSGPTDALIAVDASRKQVVGVRLRSSYDTSEYVDRVRQDDEYLKSLSGRSIDEWSKLDFSLAGVEGVSGATQTSYGLAEGIHRRLAAEMKSQSATPSAAATSWRPVGHAAVILGALAITFVPGFGGRRMRVAWQVVLVLLFGLWLGDLLSVALLAGWSRNGVPSSMVIGVVVMVAVSLFVPWGTRRQIYCHAMCPHGAVQEWLGRNRRWHVSLPRPVSRALGWVPAILLVAAFAIALIRPMWNLAALEPFDAWVLGTTAPASLLIGLAGLVSSVFVPQAYCRFGCPTGAFLKLIRSHGSAERLGRREALTAVAIIVAGWWAFGFKGTANPGASSLTEAASRPLEGRVFGTTWSVKVRGPLLNANQLRDDIEAELDRFERRLSHWKPESETSQFNASETTLEMDCSRELADLVALGRKLSEATDGEFDLTVGPLVDAWGYGPSGKKARPDDATIMRLLSSTGWKKLEVDASVPSLRKLDPQLQIDLGSLLQGAAVDRLFAMLEDRGLKEFLVEIGGELRVRGEWQVAIERIGDGTPAVRIALRDAALSTSGTYRQAANGEAATKHIISPKTGRPIETPWQAVSVIAPTCLEADAWDTALMALGRAREVAEERKLSVRFVERDGSVRVSTEGKRWFAESHTLLQ